MHQNLIQPMPVVRDPQGHWSHPEIPDFNEDVARFDQWLKDQDLETTLVYLESEDDSHPVWLSYFEDDNPDFSSWEPAAPEGDGWFTFSIHETEDGPVWVWARRAPHLTGFKKPAVDSAPQTTTPTRKQSTRSNDVYHLEPNERACCYFCQRAQDHTEYTRGDAFLAGAGHSPCDGNANYVCRRHLDDDAVIYEPAGNTASEQFSLLTVQPKNPE